MLREIKASFSLSVRRDCVRSLLISSEGLPTYLSVYLRTLLESEIIIRASTVRSCDVNKIEYDDSVGTLRK